MKKKPVKKAPAPARHVDESKELREAETPKADVVDNKDRKCARGGCGDPNSLHYGSPDRWCNRSGCDCQGYQ